jgi:hypothetical protein
MDEVRFNFNGEFIIQQFDRGKLKLGKILYLTKNHDKHAQIITEHPYTNSLRLAVTWISPSNWTVTLEEGFIPDNLEVLRIQKVLEGYMEGEDIRECMMAMASRLRLEHLYKTSERRDSSLGIVSAVSERLEFIQLLESKEVRQKLHHHWQPVTLYHLLTCFDILGQPDNWLPFHSWLESDRHTEERNAIISSLGTGLNCLDFTQKIHQEYQSLYGVKKSFHRFLREVLPAQTRNELLASIRIHTNSNPPKIEVISTEGSETEKENFLFMMRNNYTHKAKVIHGLHPDDFGIDINMSNSWMWLNQEKKSDKWSTSMVVGWPDVIVHTVKVGLVEYFRRSRPQV